MGWKELSADYAAYHETRGNRVCHALGIPLIILGLLRFLPGLDTPRAFRKTSVLEPRPAKMPRPGYPGPLGPFLGKEGPWDPPRRGRPPLQ